MKLTPYEERLVALLRDALAIERRQNGSPGSVRLGGIWLRAVRAALDEGPGPQERIVVMQAEKLTKEGWEKLRASVEAAEHGYVVPLEGPRMEHGLEMLTSQVSGLIEGAPGPDVEPVAVRGDGMEGGVTYWRGCKGCVEGLLGFLDTGKHIMSPPHTPSSGCKSGKHPHCTCDVCF